MKYRAIAMGIERDGHAVQSFFMDLHQAHQWAHVTSNHFKCNVHIFETYERCIKKVRPTLDRKPDSTKTAK